MPLVFTMQVLATLCPEEVRRKWLHEVPSESSAATVISGALEFLLMISLLFVRYYSFMTYRLSGLTAALMEKGGALGDMQSVFGAGITVYLEFLLQPLTVLLIYFTFTLEGAVRMSAAVATGEVVGTLPLFLFHKATVAFNAYWTEKKLGPRIPDLVKITPENDEYQIVVASCRQKEDWNSSLTIRYEGSLYEVYRAGKGERPLPYIYCLRLAPLSKTIRGLCDYDPTEAADRTK